MVVTWFGQMRDGALEERVGGSRQRPRQRTQVFEPKTRRAATVNKAKVLAFLDSVRNHPTVTTAGNPCLINTPYAPLPRCRDNPSAGTGTAPSRPTRTQHTLRHIGRELVETICGNVMTGRTLHENVWANRRGLHKRILPKNSHPPGKQEKATRTMLEQA